MCPHFSSRYPYSGLQFLVGHFLQVQKEFVFWQKSEKVPVALMQQIIVIFLPLSAETISETLLDPVKLTTIGSLLGTKNRPESSALQIEEEAIYNFPVAHLKCRITCLHLV
ncbi:hypothetical protein TNIN_236671 [Trichonephila inaurata madagascariensis]|uniref:Uncharacterized protein n=1 Tax=Trichonephila inaurata madagascariensis TaxID=2747483 RepID=A0A8X7CQ23_9ARAC|nr:hypothetical protein TNIN_236671 [Trichonephila inaurata madagascariensis]